VRHLNYISNLSGPNRHLMCRSYDSNVAQARKTDIWQIGQLLPYIQWCMNRRNVGFIKRRVIDFSALYT
jgi:hypothetical protein